ncbi:MAG: HAMP domain-containing histidine kinase [Clostridium sp.]|nr:HAMP domain-containing histidine kinase [Clostridium sp.]
MMISIIALSFTMLSTAFMLLSYRYMIQDERDDAARNVGYIATFTTSYLHQNVSIQTDFYRNYIASIALISDSIVMVADPQGQVVYATDGSYFYNYDTTLPNRLVKQVFEDDGYTGLTVLPGIAPESQYVAALPITTGTGPRETDRAMVLVAADASRIAEMWNATATIFFFSVMAVLLITIVTCSIMSAYQAKPLRDMADAARRFGRGDFTARVTGYEKAADEIVDLAESFNTMAASLAKVEKQRDDFIANVSHELKTPMTTIAGFAEGIIDGTIPEEREQESLQIIVSETRRLSRLVRRMLDLSRLDAASEKAVTAQEQFDLTEIASQVLISLEGKITSRNLDVDVQMPEDKLMVWGDPDSITQVCYNLMDNAAKFAVPGSAITLQIVKKDGKAYTTIKNLGATIPKEELPLLFDRFHKADSSRSMDREGVGLGLYIVKTIMSNLGESIAVTSEDGVTAFTFTLTLA